MALNDLHRLAGQETADGNLGESAEPGWVAASPQQSEPQGRKCMLPWMDMRQLREFAEADVPWIWDGVFARKAVTVLASEPKAGKSTLIFGLAAKLLAGESFLELPTKKCGVIILSEESADTLREKADRFDLPESDIVILSRRMCNNVDLKDALDEAVLKASQVEAGLIVVDTLSCFASFVEQDENNAGSVEPVMQHFRNAADKANAAICVVHHLKKGTEKVRGSSAISGAADVIFLLSKVSDSSTRRKLTNDGCRYTSNLETIVFDLTHDTYKRSDSPQNLTITHSDVFEALPKVAPGDTIEVIRSKVQKTDYSARRALASLCNYGHATRTGSGKSNDPYRYHWAMK